MEKSSSHVRGPGSDRVWAVGAAPHCNATRLIRRGVSMSHTTTQDRQVVAAGSCGRQGTDVDPISDSTNGPGSENGSGWVPGPDPADEEQPEASIDVMKDGPRPSYIRPSDSVVKRVRCLFVACLLCVAPAVSGCSNIGSSNGENSRCGSSNYTPAGLTSPNNRPPARCLPPGK